MMKRGLVAAAVASAAALGLLYAQEAAKAPATGTPKIRFDRTTFDFGKTSQVETVSGTFTFENVGTGVLNMAKPITSCGCTVAGIKPEVLQPGQKGELSFQVHLPRTRANLQKQITVVCNDPANPRSVLNIKVDYYPLYEVSPAYFSLTLRKGQSTNLTARISRSDGKPFSITKVQPSQATSANWLQAKAEPDVKSTNGGALININVKPEGGPRYFSDVVHGYTDESQQAAFSVTVYGRVIGDLTASPEMVYWPITDPARAITTRQIILRSALADKLEIKSVSSTLTNLTVQAVPRDDKTVELVAKLGAIPEHNTNGLIRIESNVPNQPKLDVPVTITVSRPIVPSAVPAASIKR
jgi:hypothetical protein